MIHSLLLFMLWFIVWLFLSWPPDPRSIASGLIVAFIVNILTSDLFTERPRLGRAPVSIFWFIVYMGVFIGECLKANFDVAFRVLHPGLPIRPGTVRVRTSLKGETALTFLANSVSLTPGNTTIDIDKKKGYIYIHRLYIKEGSGDDGGEAAKVVARFERILKRVFE